MSAPKTESTGKKFCVCVKPKDGSTIRYELKKRIGFCEGFFAKQKA
jgi:hypothetical protein